VDLFAELLRLTAAFDAEHVDYAICGAIALAVHGAPRATKDIDIMAREEDLDRLRKAATTCGFTIEALPMTFESSGISIRRFTKIEPAGRTLMLDVLIADSSLAAVWSSRMRLDVALSDGETRALSVVSRQGLVTLKLAAGRPQDLVDVRRLQELSRDEGE
jgi:hypothetical protein